MRYLHTWHEELFGRSGVGMDGLAPLSYSTLAHWQATMHVTLLPHEVSALLLLDSVRRHPPKLENTEHV